MSEAWKPKPYQLRAARWLVERGGAGLFLDPGLGKTSITLAAIKTLREVGEARRPFLVVAPLRPAWLVWPAEATKWREFARLRVEVLHGKTKEAALRRPADVQVINPEGLEWLLWRIGRRSARTEWPWHGLVLDESTLFKHSQTKRFKLLRAVLPKFHRRWILTGTPAPNGLLDLFGQLYVLDFGDALGRYITHYRRAYFAPTGYDGRTWVPQRGAEERIYQRIAPLVLRMAEKDYLKLPPVFGAFTGEKRDRGAVVKVELPKKARKVYDQLETIFFTNLKSGHVTAANAGVASIKLRQVAAGGVYLDAGGDEDADVVGGGRRWELLHEAKSEAVAELLDELSGKPALIAWEFRHDLERLRRHRDLRNVPAFGEGSTRDDAALERAWNAGELTAVLVNAQSVAHGLNLQQGGRAVIWHSLTWNYEYYWQLIKRVWRQGQKRKTFVYHVVARDTVDEAMCDVLAAKGRTQQHLLRALRAYSFRRATSL